MFAYFLIGTEVLYCYVGEEGERRWLFEDKAIERVFVLCSDVLLKRIIT